MARDFLLEIGTEELPAAACAAVLELLPGQVVSLFQAEDVDVHQERVQVLVSPRRIAVVVREVPEFQQPKQAAQRGPSADVAFDSAGNPTQAAVGFARAKGVDVADLQVREEGGRRCVYVVSRSEGRRTSELLGGLCERIIRELYFPKTMRWAGRDLRFARPIRWLVALFGSDVVPFEVAGVRTGRVSRGHRWLGGPVEITGPGEYVDALRAVSVMVDHEEREAFLWSELRRVAGEHGLEVIDPTGKMGEVLFLVEWPTVLLGRFAEDHLRLPEEVLITAMQSHQRYFPLVDGDGALANSFLFVMNGDPACSVAIVAGNERVLEGRMEDAEFSFEKDLATGIEEMAKGLDRVVFHEKIGTMKDKTERLAALVAHLAEVAGIPGDLRVQVTEAARLAKADQVSVMVREFPDLEGSMGETYARMEGFHEDVARAIREQYLPKASGGALPHTVPGALLSTAEKIDNIVAAFAVGEPPSGSKDPYGLRRAAMGMVAICFLHDLTYDIKELAQFAYAQLEKWPHLLPREQVVGEAVDFILERLSRFLIDAEIGREAVEAVLSTSYNFQDLRRRASAVHNFRTSESWDDVVVAFTRPSNLARQLPLEAAGPVVDPGLFEDGAENELYQGWRQVTGRAGELATAGQYYEALEVLATLRPLVDRFFDRVLVMTEEESTRLNRLRLLTAITQTFQKVAHLERIAG